MQNKKFCYLIIGAYLVIVSCFLGIWIQGCGQTSSTSSSTYQNWIPFPNRNVVILLNEFKNAYSPSSIKASGITRAQGLVSNSYAQAGIDLGYFDGFAPVISTLQSQILTAIATNEYTFSSTYDATAGGANIPFKGLVDYISSEAKYLVKVWGIRQGESFYRRWFFGELMTPSKGSIIIDPYIMWTSTHSFPMTIKFDYDTTQAGTKVCTGGATGKWSSSSEVIGSTYFYCKEDTLDSSNTIVTLQMYENTTSETTGLSIIDKIYGKFNRNSKRMHGRDWTTGYFEPDSGLMYLDVDTFATIEGIVPTNIDASGMSFPSTPEANYAGWPATSEFPLQPTF